MRLRKKRDHTPWWKPEDTSEVQLGSWNHDHTAVLFDGVPDYMPYIKDSLTAMMKEEGYASQNAPTPTNNVGLYLAWKEKQCESLP